MTTNAWIFMLTAWTIVVASTVYCFAKLVRKGNLMDYDEEGNRTEPWGDPSNSSNYPPVQGV